MLLMILVFPAEESDELAVLLMILVTADDFDEPGELVVLLLMILAFPAEESDVLLISLLCC